jgi:hypothetical protein
MRTTDQRFQREITPEVVHALRGWCGELSRIAPHWGVTPVHPIDKMLWY